MLLALHVELSSCKQARSSATSGGARAVGRPRTVVHNVLAENTNIVAGSLRSRQLEKVYGVWTLIKEIPHGVVGPIPDLDAQPLASEIATGTLDVRAPPFPV